MKRIFFSIACLVMAGGIAHAQDGTLDNTFGTDGKVITSFGSTYDYCNQVLIQSDGKIVAAGFSKRDNSNTDFALVRYTSDGSLDDEFGTDGEVFTDLGKDLDLLYSAALQSDDKIVAVGLSDYRIALVRYNTDGSLDNTFDNDGMLFTTIRGIQSQGNSVAIQKDGKIVIAASGYNGTSEEFAIMRFNSDGVIDNNFGTNGSVANNLVKGRYLTIQEDGKIVVAGSAIGTTYSFAAARFNSEGTIDVNFGNNGLSKTTLGAVDAVRNVAIQEDGKIVLAGYTNNTGEDANFALVRFKSDGSLDNSFDGDGKLISGVGTGDDEATSLILSKDGKIIVAGGSAISPSSKSFVLIRLNNDGSLDNSFGEDGTVMTSFGSDDYLSSIALQDDGKIVAAGNTTSNNDTDFAIARYSNSITLGNEAEIVLSSISVYPNPSANQINITASKSLANASIKLMNLSGQVLIQKEKISGASINLDISAQENGIYFLEINEGSNVARMKLVKN